MQNKSCVADQLFKLPDSTSVFFVLQCGADKPEISSVLALA